MCGYCYQTPRIIGGMIWSARRRRLKIKKRSLPRACPLRYQRLPPGLSLRTPPTPCPYSHTNPSQYSPQPLRLQLPARSAHASWHNKLWYADCRRGSPSFNCALKGALASDNVALMRNWHFVTRSPRPLRMPDKMLRCFLRRTTVLPSNAPILLCDPLDEYRFHCGSPPPPPTTTPSFQRSNYKRFKTIPALIDKG